VNGALALMKYETMVTTSDATRRLRQEIPYLGEHPSELRLWTIRKVMEEDPEVEERPEVQGETSSWSDFDDDDVF
jgi:hypothetical protein